MGSGKRASMREGPLAALFQRTDAEAPEGQQKPPDIETTVSPELRKELEERLRDDVRALRTFVDGDFDGWGIA